MRLSNLALALTSIYGNAFNPASLFLNGEQGWVYDPNNLSTLFQDSAGTTPVTAMEQPVGLQLDTRLGAPTTLGAELVTNGDFSGGTTGWQLNSAAVSITAGALVFDGTTSITSGTTPVVGVSPSGTVVAGKWYKVTYTIGSTTTLPISIGLTNNLGTARTDAGTYTEYILATNTGDRVTVWARATTGARTGSVDNISIKELPGNHRYQTTSANRPVVSARVNLLTKTEQFDDAAWTKTNGTITPNATTAPDGTLTADKLVENTASGNHRVFQNAITAAGTSTLSVYVKSAGRTKIELYASTTVSTGCGFDLSTESIYTNTIDASKQVAGTITAVGDGWYRCSLPVNIGADTRIYLNDGTAVNYTGDGTSGIYIWGADLRVSNIGVSLPAYQRVNTSTDYDTAGFPVYIKPNGSNQFMVTNSINFSATDKMTVWQGVRKLSDAAFQSIAELSATADTNNGSFCVGASTLNGDGLRRTWASVATGTINTLAGVGVYAQPDTKVVTTIYNLALATAAEENVMRLNGVAQTLTISGATAGTGNFGTYPAYFYMRGGVSNPFNGHDYGSICRGAASTAGEITSAETWINNRTKAY